MRNFTGSRGIACVLTASFFFSSSTLQASAIPVVPGGTAILHLDSQVGLTTSVDGIDTVVDNWADQSTFLNHVGSGATQRPKLIPGTSVGLSVPVLDFDGANDRLLNSGNAGVMSTVGGDSTYNNITIFVVAAVGSQPNGWRAFLSGKPTAVASNDWQLGFTMDLGNTTNLPNWDRLNYEGRQTSGAKDLHLTSNTFDTSHVLTIDANAAYNIATLYIDGATHGSTVAPPTGGFLNGANVVDIAQLRVGGRFFGGNEQGYIDAAFAKVVLYEGNLNTAERIIVENNLTAATGASLGTGDRYAGDTLANGDYDLDVIGIGRVDSTNALIDTTSISGLRIQEDGGSLTDGDFLLAGHNVDANALVALGAGDRWSRVWYLDKSDGAAIDATLSFDFSDADLAPPLPTDLVNLLYSPTDPFSFSTLSLPAIVSGDTFTFNVPDGLLLDGYYTLEVHAVPEPASVIVFVIGSMLICPFLRRRRLSVMTT
jgi:hypothetical protein